MGRSLRVVLVDWRSLAREHDRLVAEHVDLQRGLIAGLREGRLGVGLAKREVAELIASHERELASPAWRPTIAVPDAWRTDYAPLSYVGAGKDFLGLSLTWDTLRDGISSDERDRFDPFFRRIGWNPDDYDGSPTPGEGFYCDLQVDLDDAGALVLGPDTTELLLGWWRDDLVHRWDVLRPVFDAQRRGYFRFREFDAFGAFVLRWIDAFEFAARSSRGLIGAYG